MALKSNYCHVPSLCKAGNAIELATTIWVGLLLIFNITHTYPLAWSICIKVIRTLGSSYFTMNMYDDMAPMFCSRIQRAAVT